MGAGEEPDGDGLVGPLGGIDAAADGVEAWAVGVGVGAHVSAPGVLFLTGRVAVAVRGVGFREGAGVANGAASVGVQGHLVGGLGVDAFDDVDFTAFGPGALAEQPEGGPGPAADRHVRDVGDEETFVEGFFRADAHAAAAGGAFGVVVDADVAGVAVVGDAAD